MLIIEQTRGKQEQTKDVAFPQHTRTDSKRMYVLNKKQEKTLRIERKQFESFKRNGDGDGGTGTKRRAEPSL